MRLLNYLSYSGLDEETNIFRSLSINLKKTNDSKELIDNIEKRYMIEPLDDLIRPLNNELRQSYNGAFRFAFSLSEDVSLYKIKVNPIKIETIRLMQLEANDQFSKLKRQIETQAKNNIQYEIPIVN